MGHSVHSGLELIRNCSYSSFECFSALKGVLYFIEVSVEIAAHWHCECKEIRESGRSVKSLIVVGGV